MSAALNRKLLNNCVQDKESASFKEPRSHAKTENGQVPPVAIHRLGIAQNSVLAQIAEELSAPIILASCLDGYNVMQYNSFGLDLDSGFCRLAHASHHICQAGMQLFPDIGLCPELSFFRKRSGDDLARFYIGIPIKNVSGKNVGSLAVLQASKSIAANGFSLRRFYEMGQMLVINAAVPSAPEPSDPDNHIEDRITEAANKNLAISSQVSLLEHLRLTALQAKG